MMSDNQGQLRLSFIQLLLLLGLQVVLLAGTFYLGARFGSRLLTAGKTEAKDSEIAKLFPQGEVISGGEVVTNPSADKNRGSSTPFDKSSNTVFRIKSSANSEYTLQLASYPDESAAMQVVEDWKKKGYMAFLSVEEIPDRGRWYRVSIGNFGDQTAADEFAKKIEAKEGISPQVVVNE